MMKTTMNNEIKKVLRLSQNQINLSVLLRSVFVGVIVSCSICLVANIYFIVQGYAAQTYLYFINFGLFVLLATIHFLIYFVNMPKTAVIVDKAYNLKEGLLSHIGFQNKGLAAGVFKLQEDKLIADLSEVRGKSLFVMPHKNLIWLSVMLLTSMCLVGFMPESERVASKKKQEEQMLKITAKNIEELNKALEELEKELTDEEKELLKKSKIIQAVKEIEENKNKEEAFSDLAKLEQELRKELKSDQFQANLATLKNLEEEALKFEETKELGEDLQKKDFKKAAEDLKKFELDEKLLKDLQEELKNKKELSKEEMKELKEKLANKVASQAKNMKALNKSVKKSLSKENANGKEGVAGELGELSEELSEIEGDLDKLAYISKMEKLSKEELEELMKNCENCQNCSGDCNSKLDKLGKSLKKMGVQKGYMDKLFNMKEKLNMAQMAVATESIMPGGKKPGEGVDRNLTGQKDSLKDNSQFTQIKGQKGEGAGLVSIEDAASGTGVSRVQGKATKVEFKAQAESFMNREDIPDDLKGGVKNYFNSIHNIDDTKKE